MAYEGSRVDSGFFRALHLVTAILATLLIIEIVFSVADVIDEYFNNKCLGPYYKFDISCMVYALFILSMIDLIITIGVIILLSIYAFIYSRLIWSKVEKYIGNMISLRRSLIVLVAVLCVGALAVIASSTNLSSPYMADDTLEDFDDVFGAETIQSRSNTKPVILAVYHPQSEVLVHEARIGIAIRQGVRHVLSGVRAEVAAGVRNLSRGALVGARRLVASIRSGLVRLISPGARKAAAAEAAIARIQQDLARRAQISFQHADGMWQVRIPGDVKTQLRFVSRPNGLIIDAINSVNLGRGGGRALAIHGLKMGRVTSLGREIHFKNVINPQTQHAAERGLSVADTPIGKLGKYIAKSYGRSVKSYHVERILRDKFNVIIYLD